MLHSHVESGHPHLAPDLSGKALFFINEYVKEVHLHF